MLCGRSTEKEAMRMMELMLIYGFTMAATLAIGLYGVQKQTHTRNISRITKLLLVIPVKDTTGVPTYLIATHGAIQILSILAVICSAGNFLPHQRLQKVYGLCMIGFIMPAAIIMNRFSKKT